MTQRLVAHLSDYADALIPRLQEEFGCESRSELIELLILSQAHSAKDARALLMCRTPRGRPWPAVVVLPDDAVLPPEGD